MSLTQSRDSSKSPEKSPVPFGALVTPKHGGGKIRHGGKKGDPGGPGRPKSEIRERLLGAVDKHGVGFVEDVLSGKTAATVAEKAMVLDKAAKYGLGALKGVTDEEVGERLDLTIKTIREKLPKAIRTMGEGQTISVALDEKRRLKLPIETPEQVVEALLKMIEPHWR